MNRRHGRSVNGDPQNCFASAKKPSRATNLGPEDVPIISVGEPFYGQTRAGRSSDRYTIAGPLVGNFTRACRPHKERSFLASCDFDIGWLVSDGDSFLLPDEGDLAKATSRRSVITLERLVQIVKVAIDWVDCHIDQTNIRGICKHFSTSSDWVHDVNLAGAVVACEVLIVEPRRERSVGRLVEGATDDRTPSKRVIREVVDMAIGPKRINERRMAWVVGILRPFSFKPAIVCAALEHVQLLKS